MTLLLLTSSSAYATCEIISSLKCVGFRKLLDSSMGEIMSCLALISFKYFFYVSIAGDTMFPNQPLKDGQNLVSAGGMFELGFFSPSSSSNRYIGIWYADKPPRKVVWVANREAPIKSSTAILHLGLDGNLNLLSSEKTIWSTDTSGASVLQLLDSGNLVLSDSERLIWQSFDHPSHTMLPGMKIGRDFRTNNEWALTAWKSDSDPSPGAYSYRVYSEGPPELYVTEGSVCIWRVGTWTGHGWDGLSRMTIGNLFDPQLISNQDELYYMVELRNKSIASPVLLNPDGSAARWMWVGGEWNSYWKLPADVCDTYAICGVYGVCRNDSPDYCSCLRGFEPRSKAEWGLHEWSGGCMRREALGRDKGDGFLRVGQLKLPDTRNASWNSSKGIHECREWCLQNCSCQAFAVITEGSGCIVWFEILIDISELTQGGEDLYVRVASSEIADVTGTNGTSSTEKGSHSKNGTSSTEKGSHSHSKKSSAVIITIAVVSGMILVSVALLIVCMRQRKGQRTRKQLRSPTASKTEEFDSNDLSNIVTKDHELPSFPFWVIATSTNNFSNETKIGVGGFGTVHKGTLPNGQQIAVKRLSKRSSQGADEFKNEIKLISNLQHKNLVRLLGCSINDNERLLVYEYMANGSLDKFLFDPTKAVHLDWHRRIGIIHGIAQGLLYLHKYSRLRIIHRDLKCSNILLDADMNPKISDFGIARILGGNQDHANTRRVVGTYGYMPPEYAIKGLFSEKSDAFSYGVLLLEVISGKKNNHFDQIGALPGRAWELWNSGRVPELMDPVLGQSCPLPELIRCVQVGLLCVQEKPEERPTMTSVIFFLSSDTTALPSPRNVAFITSEDMNVYSLSSEGYGTPNEVTITAVVPR